MTVNCVSFLVFLAFLTVIYYIIRPKYQWICLLVASCAFYALAGTTVFAYVLITCVSTYAAVRWMESLDLELAKHFAMCGEGLSLQDKKAQKARTKFQKKKILTGVLVLNIGILILTKYCDFLIGNLNSVLGIFGILGVNRLGLAAPLGISYYTLQSMGYVLDVYKGKCRPEQNFFKSSLFIIFFPQMTQGPIGRFSDLAPQLFAPHSFSYANLSMGCQRMLWGFFKKSVIADRLKPVADEIFGNYSQYGGMTLFLGCVYLSVQIYADFSGYMDIVSGASEILGIRLAENFRRPFFSCSLAEYWRRWHITLSSWFRDYLFYPLSISKWAVKFGKLGKRHFGVRIGKLFPSVFALFIVWFSTGLWHDSSWRYILWGVANGAVIIGAMWMEPWFNRAKNLLHIRDSNPFWKLFCILRTFLLVCFLKVFPGPPDTYGTLVVIRKLFTDFRLSLSYDAFFPGLKQEHLKFISFGLVIFFLVSLIQEHTPIRESLARRPLAVRWFCYFLLLGSILIMGAFEISMVGGFAYAQY